MRGEKSSAPEYYGFIAWLLTYIAFVLYVLWAVLPDEWIESVGITWFPNREWAILIPAWTVVVGLLTYFSYYGLALYNTPGFSEVRTMSDSLAIPQRVTGTNSDLYDVPLSSVNRRLYR